MSLNMRVYEGFVCAALMAGAAMAQRGAPEDLTLWYRQPAVKWTEALPVGNGQIGAMVFGGTRSERVQFNEHTVWSGEPHDYAHPGAVKHLEQIRSLLFAGKQKEAEDLAGKEFMSIPLGQKSYQAFGDLTIETPGLDEVAVTSYRRSLDLRTAIARTEYASDGVTYVREVFASYPAHAIVVRLTASRKGALALQIGLKSAHADAAIEALSDSELKMTGRVADSAIRFQARIIVATQGGTQTHENGKLLLRGGDSATIMLTGATNFVNWRDVSGDPDKRVTAALRPLRTARYENIRSQHIADHQKLFNRVSLTLGTSAASKLPTDERIRQFAKQGDPELVALIFQYGRYLLIGSSRPGGQPANLQGIWNDSNRPAWDSKYTVNINTEMNYWPAEVANLPECTAPLFAALSELAASGAVTAKEQYGARGWVLHHNFDLWRGTAPINASNHGIWQVGGAWLSTHLWEHYLYTGDREFLRQTAYPLMKGAALFFVDTLVTHPDKGWLVTGPSNSPEQGGLVMGPTMDHQIVRALFGDVIAASRTLGVDAELRKQLEDLRGRIAPDQIGKYGQLQEWIEDKDDPTNQHRHVSHLWGVFPGYEITPVGTPELFAAARKSLGFRGDAATGWSMGWKINLWAHFLDGDHAYLILKNLVQPASHKSETAGKVSYASEGAGLYDNLFDAHPPFQIDGNFGATSGIAQMLLQSTDPAGTPTSETPAQMGDESIVTLLPALPTAFPNGSVNGLRAPGGLELSLAWTGGALSRASIHASFARTATVRYAGKTVNWKLKAGETRQFDAQLRPIAAASR